MERWCEFSVSLIMPFFRYHLYGYSLLQTLYPMAVVSLFQNHSHSGSSQFWLKIPKSARAGETHCKLTEINIHNINYLPFPIKILTVRLLATAISANPSELKSLTTISLKACPALYSPPSPNPSSPFPSKT